MEENKGGSAGSGSEKSGNDELGEKGERGENIEKIDMLLTRLDTSGIEQYVRLSQNMPRVLWLNFLSGIARGLGFTVGTAIVIAVAYKILSGIISMNIPYLTEMLEDFIRLVDDIAITRVR